MTLLNPAQARACEKSLVTRAAVAALCAWQQDLCRAGDRLSAPRHAAVADARADTAALFAALTGSPGNLTLVAAIQTALEWLARPHNICPVRLLFSEKARALTRHLNARAAPWQIRQGSAGARDLIRRMDTHRVYRNESLCGLKIAVLDELINSGALYGF